MKRNVLLLFLFAVTFFSTAAAQSWEPLGPFGIHTLVKVVESDSAIIMLAEVPAGTRVYRSEDNGITWEESPVPYNKLQAAISHIECINNVFYAATFHSDLCMSTDHGRTWIVRNDIHDGQMSFPVGSMLNVNNSLYVGWGDKFYNSNDSGLTYFFQKARVDGDMIKSFIVNDNIVTVTKNGVFRSDDRAGTWKTITPSFVEDDYDGRDLAVIGNTIYVSTYRRVYYSSDLGASWNVTDPFRVGPTYIRIAAYASRLWIASDSSLYYTSDNFASVKKASMPPTYRFSWTLASTRGALFMSAIYGGAYVTHDSATTWTFLEDGLPPREMGNVWAESDVLFAGTTRGLLMRSTNNGIKWEKSFQSLTVAAGSNQFSAMFAIGDSIVITTDEDNTFYFSGNDGGSWATNNKSAPWYEIHDIAGNNDVWVAVVKRDGSAYRSTDRGNSWTIIKGSYANDNFRMVILHDTSFFAASTNGGIWSSNADATKFTKLDEGVGLTKQSCYSIASNGKTIFAGSRGALYRSRDSGASWQEIIGPFTSQVYDIKCYGNNVVILERTPTSNMIYFSPNECDTIYTLTEGGFTSRETWEVAINDKYLFAQSKDKAIFRYNYLPLKSVKQSGAGNSVALYPNPTNGIINITLPTVNTSIRIVDMLGREVHRGFINETTAQLDLRHLPDGVYTIIAGGLRTSIIVE